MRRVMLVLLIWAATTPLVIGQQKPDVSGSWVAASDAPADMPGAPSPILGPRIWLRQSAGGLTIVRPSRDTVTTTTLPLDGREVRTRIPGAVCQGDTQSIETAAWDGHAIALTLVGSIPAGGGQQSKLSVRRLLRLQSPDVLVIEASMRDPASGGMRRVGTVYKRTEDPEPSPSQRGGDRSAAATIAQIAWLSGVWVGTSGTATVEERWTPAGGGSILGVARTLRDGVMSSFEFLCIAERHGGLVYTAMPNARTPATDFMSTTVTPDSATFENPAHDFPKMIRYARLADGSLETTTGGDAKQKPAVVILRKQP